MRAQVLHLLQEQVGLKAGEKIVVAVSGGLDSMVLLDILDHLREPLAICLHVGHFDHQLRPESSADSHFVAAAAQQYGLPCACAGADVGEWACQQRLSVEEAGRRLRYHFLDEVARECGATRIALGHHAGDQAETVLLRLLRGSGACGLGAMEVVRDGRYLRPLLLVERAVIQGYAREGGIVFREDASNQDLRFVRNRVRHELIPYLQHYYNPRVIQALGRTARVLKEEDHSLDTIAQQALETVICERYSYKVVLAVGPLLDYHIAVQRRLMRILLEDLSHREGPFDFADVEVVLEWARQSSSGLGRLPAGVWFQRAGERLILRRGDLPPVAVTVRIPGWTEIAGRGLGLSAELLPARCFPALKPTLGGGRAAFDAGLTGVQLELRTLRPGDRFHPLGMHGHKKLSDFLIDLKWPRLLRDEVLLLARGEEIIWVAGLRPSHPFRVQETTEQILVVALDQDSC